MNTLFDIAFIRSKGPCYDPARYLPEGWKGSVKGILRHRDIPAKDKLWVVLRSELLSSKTLRLFAVACARRALARIPNPDLRSLKACNVAESFANGIATREELALASADAYDAAAAYYTAPTASAAYEAAAAAAATTTAAAAANRAADCAADCAERQWQVECLINMLK